MNYKDIKTAVEKNQSMLASARYLGIGYVTFKKYAVRYGLWQPNQSGKGIHKRSAIATTPLIEILIRDREPVYNSCKLRLRLIKENIKQHQCEKCKLTVWNNKPIPLELEHIDGDKHNNLLKNLKLLCPNCHAQTETYRGKNIGAYGRQRGTRTHNNTSF